LVKASQTRSDVVVFAGVESTVAAILAPAKLKILAPNLIRLLPVIWIDGSPRLLGGFHSGSILVATYAGLLTLSRYRNPLVLVRFRFHREAVGDPAVRTITVTFLVRLGRYTFQCLKTGDD